MGMVPSTGRVAPIEELGREELAEAVRITEGQYREAVADPSLLRDMTREERLAWARHGNLRGKDRSRARRQPMTPRARRRRDRALRKET
jgi:hypothetical protein